ncbi:unnamed protein product [Leptidea sinapis]|uniref:Uncharacterized protein n=1 Tax=Leptidea sinapis TaxID=189913 RepID=A0A5E4QRM8_9NEOP|nr:unnamed protein product [Leptidea sinapis]
MYVRVQYSSSMVPTASSYDWHGGIRFPLCSNIPYSITRGGRSMPTNSYGYADIPAERYRWCWLRAHLHHRRRCD